MNCYSYDELLGCASQIRNKIDFCPEYAISLSRSLYGFIDKMDIAGRISYDSFKAFSGLKGEIIFGTFNGKKIMAFLGRIRIREGVSYGAVMFPVRLSRLLGASVFVFTNASGSLVPEIHTGDFVLVNDHITYFLGDITSEVDFDDSERLQVDMRNIYDADIRTKVLNAAKNDGINATEGVMVQAPGCVYETPAECRMFGILGASIVAQSGAAEATCARYIGMKYCLISSVSNMAANFDEDEISNDAFVSNIKKTADNYLLLMESIFREN